MTAQHALVVHLPEIVAIRILKSGVATVLRSKELILHHTVAVAVQYREDKEGITNGIESQAGHREGEQRQMHSTRLAARLKHDLCTNTYTKENQSKTQ